MKTFASIAVGAWLVLTVTAGGAGAGIETKSDPNDVYWSDRFPVPGTNGEVNAAVKDAWGNIYIGGNFTLAGDIMAENVARWNTSKSTWSGLGTGIGGIDHSRVLALAVDSSGNVYAGGYFTTAGGLEANCIARWDGTAWSALGTGMEGGSDYPGTCVYALAVDSSGNLYAGGDFTTAGGVAANYIAKWDGAAWSPLGTGMGGSSFTRVLAIAVDGLGAVYAGGMFTTAGGVTVNCAAKWDGTAWSALGTGIGGTDSHVDALAVDGSGVYAGGAFTTAGGVSAKNIAKWDGMAWSALGIGI
ncbi:MAG: hypothetical protein NTZ09_02490, partial [Candidatus Hydrogenedentes bacterium]|nr:hypothetical protein [Candidatus Hydrogenedentota bacterium]